MRVSVAVDTLSVTHIFDGEEVVAGGDDGQAYVATFAEGVTAEHYLYSLKAAGVSFVVGWISPQPEVLATNENGQRPQGQARCEDVDPPGGDAEGRAHEADERQNEERQRDSHDLYRDRPFNPWLSDDIF